MMEAWYRAVWEEACLLVGRGTLDCTDRSRVESEIDHRSAAPPGGTVTTSWIAWVG